MAETLTVDTSPDTEVLTSDEQESLEIGEKMQAEQEGLLAGKYKDAQELEKAYIELQGKLGKPREEEEVTPEASQEEESSEPEEKSEEVDASFLDTLWEESQGEWTDDTMKQLSEMSPRDLAQMHLEYRANVEKGKPEPLTQETVDNLKSVAGGDKAYDSMLGWAKSALTADEISMYDAVIEKGDPLSCFFAIQALKYRYDDASGVEGQMLTGKAPSSSGDQFKSNAQLVAAMSDPKYDNDPAYRQEVMEKLERSNLEF